MVQRSWLQPIVLWCWAAPLAAQESGALTGTVFEAGTHRPLSGAHLTVPGRPHLAVKSDSTGTFQLFHLPAGSLRVSVALRGYASLIETVPIGEARVTVADFELTRVDAVLDEVVTAGAGARRRDEGSRIEDVAARDLEGAGGATLGEALAHHLTGAEVLWSSGQVGAGASIILRGLKSWRHDSRPVVYVDGVRLADASGPAVSDARVSALDLIDPSTVERIEIVRGPAALRFGAGASSGVVLIHTRRGSLRR